MEDLKVFVFLVLVSSAAAVTPTQDGLSIAMDGLVPVIGFQEDGVPTTESWTLWNGSMPDFQSLSICFWIKVSYWRVTSAVFSYAVDDLIDNAFSLDIKENYIEATYYNNDIFSARRNNPLLQWIHLCVLASDNGLYVYVDGTPLENQVDPIEWNATFSLEGNGKLVLGQDQDLLGEGFAASESFSGFIGDFQLFARDLSQDEISVASHCQEVIPGALLTLAKSSWVFNNVTNSSVRRESFCEVISQGHFFVFRQSLSFEKNRQHCDSLGGQLPSASSIQEMTSAFEQYAMSKNKSFLKFHVKVDRANSSNTQQGKYCLLKLLWHPPRKTLWSIACVKRDLVTEFFMCNVPFGTFIRFYVFPELSHEVDTHYLVYPSQGRVMLRGVSASYIILDDAAGAWQLCVSQKISFRYFWPKSEYPPLGRSKWINDSIILLTGCRRNQFTCDSGQCIDLLKRCDMRMDCGDDSDESGCELIMMEDSQYSSLQNVPKTPLSVIGNINISRILEIDISRNKFSAIIYVNLMWQDDRLHFYNVKDESVVREESFQAWYPDLILSPLISGGVPKIQDFILHRKCPGRPVIFRIKEEMKYNTTCAQLQIRRYYHTEWLCNFNLRRFPFEIVFCNISFLLKNGQLWDRNNTTINKPVFTNWAYLVTIQGVTLSDSVLTVTIIFQRQYGGYLVTTLIPLILMTFIGGLTFLFDTQDFSNRVMVTLTCFIVTASLLAQISASLPQTSYMKLFDLFFLGVIFFLSVIFMCHVILAYRRRRGIKQVMPSYGHAFPKHV